MGCECFDVARFDLRHILQGQMRIAKLKSAYNSIIKMLFILKILLRWIHLASGHRCVLGLVDYVIVINEYLQLCLSCGWGLKTMVSSCMDYNIALLYRTTKVNINSECLMSLNLSVD